MSVIPLFDSIVHEDIDTTIFSNIASDIVEKGFSITPNALPPALLEELWLHLRAMPNYHFSPAGIGREQEHTINKFVRTDEICWINGESQAGLNWLAWAGDLQKFINRELFLGLFSFESHFAHYAPGQFYKTHRDAFKGEGNRMLSMVLYLNQGWLPEDGGELVMYDENHQQLMKVTPNFGTLAVFLSEEFPHEVLPATRDRYSIAGWFRVNTSQTNKVDPPR